MGGVGCAGLGGIGASIGAGLIGTIFGIGVAAVSGLASGPGVSASGPGVWARRLGSASGPSVWAQRLGAASGLIVAGYGQMAGFLSVNMLILRKRNCRLSRAETKSSSKSSSKSSGTRAKPRSPVDCECVADQQEGQRRARAVCWAQATAVAVGGV